MEKIKDMKSFLFSVFFLAIGWVANGFFGLAAKVDDIDSRLVAVETKLDLILQALGG